MASGGPPGDGSLVRVRPAQELLTGRNEFVKSFVGTTGAQAVNLLKVKDALLPDRCTATWTTQPLVLEKMIDKVLTSSWAPRQPHAGGT